ncbi:hypothetical protein [Breoghania sp. L-A4]|uniref:hypothetical protein n=1 Tax=Breoghania sp. L-A4 TaxID=2304600 RepID=UPI0013C34D0C|nr:hypothetical protein [Breoghania sp. L-A4]
MSRIKRIGEGHIADMAETGLADIRENSSRPKGWSKPAVRRVNGLCRSMGYAVRPFPRGSNRLGPTELIPFNKETLESIQRSRESRHTVSNPGCLASAIRLGRRSHGATLTAQIGKAHGVNARGCAGVH